MNHAVIDVMINIKQNIDLCFYESDFKLNKYINKDTYKPIVGIKFEDIKTINLFKYGLFKYRRLN